MPPVRLGQFHISTAASEFSFGVRNLPLIQALGGETGELPQVNANQKYRALSQKTKPTRQTKECSKTLKMFFGQSPMAGRDSIISSGAFF